MKTKFDSRKVDWVLWFCIVQFSQISNYEMLLSDVAKKKKRIIWQKSESEGSSKSHFESRETNNSSVERKNNKITEIVVELK